MSTVWPLVPIEFVAELGTYLVDDGAVVDRLNAFAKEIEAHFTGGGAPGATVAPDFPKVGLSIEQSRDESGTPVNTVRVGSVAAKFLDTTIEDAERFAATYVPKAPFIAKLERKVVTRESYAARQADREASKAAAAEYLAAQDAKHGAERDAKQRAAAAADEVDPTFADLV